MKKIIPALAFVLVLLGGCELMPQFGAATEAAKQGIVLIKEKHFDLAMKNEELRCKRSLELVFRIADVKGEQWLASYLASCPRVQAYIQRLAGIAAISQGMRLVAPNITSDVPNPSPNRIPPQ